MGWFVKVLLVATFLCRGLFFFPLYLKGVLWTCVLAGDFSEGIFIYM
jgi:hypothetical protein